MLTKDGRSGHRLHDLRGSLPDEVTVTALHHPLFGDRLAVQGWRHVGGVVHLVVRLPDGAPGTVELSATSFAEPRDATRPETMMSVDGLRRLRALVASRLAEIASGRT